MNRENDAQERIREYDFSRGERGRYAKRFEDRREALLESAASMDRQAWIAHSLHAFQVFEAHLVAYWALALRKDPETSGTAVTSLLHACDTTPLSALREDLDQFTSVEERFYDELAQLIEDRNWLVHRSFQSSSSSRFQAIAERSERLTERLFSLLLERCKKQGMEEAEVRVKTEEVVERWAADRPAA